MKKFKKIIFVASLVIIFIPSSIYVLGATVGSGSNNTTSVTSGSTGCNNTSDVGIPNPLKGGCSLYDLVKTIANDVILPIGGVLVVFFTIYSGFLLVIAAGNEEKLKTAKRSLMWTLIGAAVLLGAWVIATAIENTVKQITAQNYEEVSVHKDRLALLQK